MANVMQMLSGASLLHQLARDVTTTLDRRLAPLGVTTQQAALLHNAASGGASPRQLMAAVGTDTAGMTKLLDRLEGKGLIERRPNPDDRRSVVIEPTEQGLALVPALAPVFGAVARQLFDGFADAEVASLTSSLRRMGENLNSSVPAPN
jgi:DNA-binding MarR family transcriptional regulator